MKWLSYVTVGITVCAALAGGPASANMCRADNLTCPTTMPAGGYCECHSHGALKAGTVVGMPTQRHAVNASSGGCGAHPDAAGCR